MTNSPPQHRNDPRRLIGRTFGGRYRIEELLGKGGMSAVYRAKHTRLGKTVALKILLGDNPNDDKQVARFTQEARACSRLKHPNIIKVFDYGQLDDGQLFISMELLLGRTMAKMVKDDGPQSPARACRTMAVVARALAEAHRLGIIHRDLKPDNVFMPQGRGDEGLKILDFGIAKVTNETSYETLTQTGFICGTPLYISPEQALGVALDGRADLYSVGVMLFELLCGHTPFNADTPIALVMKHIHNEPPQFKVMNPDVSIPQEVQDFVYRLLAKDRIGRPGTALEVANSLDALAALADAAPGPSAAVQRPPPLAGDHDAPMDSNRAALDPDRTRMELQQFDEVAHVRSDAEMLTLAVAVRPRIPAGKTDGGMLWVGLAAALVVGLTTAAMVMLVPWEDDSAPETAPTTGAATVTDARRSTPVETDPERPVLKEETPSPGIERDQPVVHAPQRVVRGGDPVVARSSRREPVAAGVAAAPAVNPTPKSRTFEIESVPPGAMIVLRGQVTGRTPYRFEATNQTPDTTLIVSMAGYLPETWQYSAGDEPPHGQSRVLVKLTPIAPAAVKKKKTPKKKKIVWEE